MDIPPFLEQKFKDAKTVDDLKAVIADILKEYNFGILSPLEERISKLEEDTG